MGYFGRKKIYTYYDQITRENVIDVLKDALDVHHHNSNQIEYLYNYYKGKQPILERTKQIRPEICNKIVENRANEIVTFKTGYLIGSPIQYVSRKGTDVTEQIKQLNDMMMLCDRDTENKKLVDWVYICGVGYLLVSPNSSFIYSQIIPQIQGEYESNLNESPFNIYSLDPRNTFVVYHSGVGEKPVMAVHYVKRQDDSWVFGVYTYQKYFEITALSPVVNGGIDTIGDYHIALEQTREIADIPIVEFYFNESRLGAFEPVLPILDAINTVQSNRADGIEQFVQSLLVFYNITPQDEENEQKFLRLREAGMVFLKNIGDVKQDIKEIASQLDQQQTQTLIDYWHQTILDIVGMPNRNGGSSTSDTGSAVILRDGWENAEARTKSDEAMMKKCDRKVLKVALEIGNSLNLLEGLRVSDIEIKFTRGNYENTLTKLQVFTSLISCDKLHPKYPFILSKLFADPEEAAEISMKYYEEKQTKEIASVENEEGDALA